MLIMQMIVLVEVIHISIALLLYINIAYAIPLFGFVIGVIVILITGFLEVKYTCVNDKKPSIFGK